MQLVYSSAAELKMVLCLYFRIFKLNTKDGSTVRYDTPNFCEEIRYAGTVRFFVTVRVRYVGTVRLFCNGTGTVRWYLV